MTPSTDFHLIFIFRDIPCLDFVQHAIKVTEPRVKTLTVLSLKLILYKLCYAYGICDDHLPYKKWKILNHCVPLEDTNKLRKIILDSRRNNVRKAIFFVDTTENCDVGKENDDRGQVRGFAGNYTPCEECYTCQLKKKAEGKMTKNGKIITHTTILNVTDQPQQEIELDFVDYPMSCTINFSGKTTVRQLKQQLYDDAKKTRSNLPPASLWTVMNGCTKMKDKDQVPTDTTLLRCFVGPYSSDYDFCGCGKHGDNNLQIQI